MTSRFKIKVKVDGGEERWADASKVFAHLIKEYAKTELKGKKPAPYKDRINNFFNTIDSDWIIALKDAYPNIDIDQELKNIKIWLLSNTKNAKSDFKKFINNWMAKAMRNGKPKTEDNRGAYQKYVPPVINDEDIPTPEEIQEILNNGK